MHTVLDARSRTAHKLRSRWGDSGPPTHALPPTRLCVYRIWRIICVRPQVDHVPLLSWLVLVVPFPRISIIITCTNVKPGAPGKRRE